MPRGQDRSEVVVWVLLFPKCLIRLATWGGKREILKGERIISKASVEALSECLPGVNKMICVGADDVVSILMVEENEGEVECFDASLGSGEGSLFLVGWLPP